MSGNVLKQGKGIPLALWFLALFLFSGTAWGAASGADLERLEADLQARGAAINELEAELKAKSDVIFGLEANIKVMNEMIAGFERELRAKDGVILKLEADVKDKDAAVSRLEADVQSKDALIADLNAKMDTQNVQKNQEAEARRQRRARAEALIQEGDALAKGGDYAGALKNYERAHRYSSSEEVKTRIDNARLALEE